MRSNSNEIWNSKSIKLKIFVSLMIGFSAFYAQAEKIISLDQAIALAQQNDPWLHGSKLKQQAVEYNSIASGTLPDPIMSVGMMNLPTDTWNLDQEGMTQCTQVTKTICSSHLTFR